MPERIYRAIAEPHATFSHGDTYNGHPVNCAAALKNLEILLGGGLVEHAARSGEQPHRRGQGSLDLPGAGNVRGLRAAVLAVDGGEMARAGFMWTRHDGR